MAPWSSSCVIQGFESRTDITVMGKYQPIIPVRLFSNQFVLLVLPETWITADKLCGAMLFFFFSLCFFFYILRRVPIYLSLLAECCNAVLIWSSRNVLWTKTLSDFLPARGWADDNWILISSCTAPLILFLPLGAGWVAACYSSSRSPSSFFPLCSTCFCTF